MRSAAQVHSFFATAADQHQGVLAGVLPEGTLIAFEIEGGGTWTVVKDRGSVRVVPHLEEPVDCRMACTVEDFDALVHGRLDAREAFLGGRVRIEGDVGLIQRLNKAFARKRGVRS